MGNKLRKRYFRKATLNGRTLYFGIEIKIPHI